ncbi:heat-inducible transcriptional repressor HrcA [Actinotalea sp. BY-33]|uniref:Heat-inducible transcription repressor HrcA n=1 Tax=Actinotalea soli TaxID=2819234 RepID=A0A939LNH9_9CELL|nr:heat-inducible transcriptional repressor HrcA [Actinotalea soli]MBO1750703.1 heat-inducible transcriptional repressor HrcA [Actinotalea soli]
MSDDRRLDVLRAIVEDYVQTQEPVGSRVLVERHALGVSPATIRNDMAALEEAGFIAQPHTSAGRVPTDKGYRMFVDRLSTIKPLSSPERRAIQQFLADAVDLDDVVDRSVRLLSQLTQQVAVVQYPSLRRSALRHLELVPVGDTRLLVVIITDTGRVEQRTLELDAPIAEHVVPELRARLNAAVAGRRLVDLPEPLEQMALAFVAEDRPLVHRVVRVVEDTLAEATEERVVMAGASHLARSGTDFSQTIRPVLEALEEQVVLLRLLTEMAEDTAGVTVRIGHENQHAGLAETSFVATGYGGDGEALARIGSLGPTRMDYAGTIASVRAVARYLSRILAG